MAGAALGGMGLGIISDLIGAGFSAARARKAYKRQKHIMKNEVQWRVKDMIAAGINPMLATYTGSAQPASVAPASTPDMGGTREAARIAFELPRRAAELKQTAAHTSYIAAQEDLANANASAARQSEATGRAQEREANARAAHQEQLNAPDWLERELAERNARIAQSNALAGAAEASNYPYQVFERLLGPYIDHAARNLPRPGRGVNEWGNPGLDWRGDVKTLERLWESIKSGASRGYDAYRDRNKGGNTWFGTSD